MLNLLDLAHEEEEQEIGKPLSSSSEDEPLRKIRIEPILRQL